MNPTFIFLLLYDHQHLPLVCHVNPISQHADRHILVEQWIQEVISIEAPSLVDELATLCKWPFFFFASFPYFLPL
ncbi:hypothetical protein MTR67_040608 [Solanum verrucosum]|uniref:Uncharacterized protein n=1 Tax=Solanum verrucosum TaxID=315347 RepID=A0AAF0ZRJ8_SOLVR|nr:hypothetical protein MTR67_040608 [Solanum verrucosum]